MMRACACACVCVSISVFFFLSVLSVGLLTVTVTVTATVTSTATSTASLPHVRPPVQQRKFISPAVEAVINNITARMTDKDLATLFSNTFPNTLDTTVSSFTPSVNSSPPDSFIITGDITAQWFRDSTNQLLPYSSLLPQDEKLQQLYCGLIHRQIQNVLHDPYANAFNFNASGAGHQDDIRKPAMTASVFEGKYELDSLAAVIRLSFSYYDNMQADVNDCFVTNTTWFQAMSLIVQTMIDQTAASTTADQSPYLFSRLTTQASDTLIMNGLGNRAAVTGMIKSAFRPSDDATLFPFFIPANAMTVVALQQLMEMLQTSSNRLTTMSTQMTPEELREQIKQRQTLIQNASTLHDSVDAGIKAYGIISTPSFITNNPNVSANFGPSMYAYEVDGYGGQNLMDDANIPSLLSLPYLGYVDVNDPIYQTTRAFVWSHYNPYFFQGTAGAGIGGPHEGTGYIWPMSLIMYALTSNDVEEITWALEVIKTSSAQTGLLHESFWLNDVNQYTRPWFAWVNGLFGSLILRLSTDFPQIIFGEETP